MILRMLCDDFIAYLARKGVLRDSQIAGGGINARRSDGLDDLDWVALTKLTPSAFADELATFCGCSRVQRGDLVAGQFAGAQLSARFLRAERLFPYEHPSGILTLAIARPTDDETVRAVEIALRRPVTMAVATVDDIDAVLGKILESERPSAMPPGEAAANEDEP